MEQLMITEIEENEELKDILSIKFAEVAKELKNVMKIASKGQRKGLLIFKTDAAKLIYAIEDKFVQYIVRSIFDSYTDIRNGMLWRMHINEMFNMDFVKSIFRKLSPLVDSLETQYKAMRDEHIHNTRISSINDILHKKYDFFLSERRINNVFNIENCLSAPFYVKYNALKAKVKAEHSRVPDDKMDAYIEKDYFYRQERETIEKEHSESFQEYNDLKVARDDIYETQRIKERDLKAKIDIELESLNYNKIKRALQGMVDNFVKVIVNSITNGTIK